MMKTQLTRTFYLLLMGFLVAGCTPNIQSYKIQFKAPRKAATGAEAPAKTRKDFRIWDQVKSSPVVNREQLDEPIPPTHEPFGVAGFALGGLSLTILIIWLATLFYSFGEILAATLVVIYFLSLLTSTFLGILSLRKYKKNPLMYNRKAFPILGLIISGAQLVGWVILMLAIIASLFIWIFSP